MNFIAKKREHMHEQPPSTGSGNPTQPPTHLDPTAFCWLLAMALAMLTPTALLFDVALWRVALAMLCELGALAFLGWLRNA